VATSDERLKELRARMKHLDDEFERIRQSYYALGRKKERFQATRN
jgi:prefoldin subunit 5